MASSNRRSRSLNIKVFLLSGFEINRRKDLGKKIERLGGKHCDIKHFNAGCTHVICEQLSRSEKFLGACATGKWLLHSSYIEDCCVAECWLDEEQYEWCDYHISKSFPVDNDLAIVSRRWRFLLGDTSLAFSGWKVAVVASQSKSMVIKRLLSCGGAEIYDLKMPIKNPGKVADSIGYIFVSANMIHCVAHLIDYGALLIKPEFIADFLIKDPQPDAMDYLVQCDDASYISNNADPLDEDSFLMSSQRSMYISPTKMENTTIDVDTTPGTSRHSTPSHRSNLFPSSRLNELPCKSLINSPSVSDRLIDRHTSSPISSLLSPKKDVRLLTPSGVVMSPIVIKSEKKSPLKISSLSSSFLASATATTSAAVSSSSQNNTGSSTLSLIDDVIDLTGTDDEEDNKTCNNNQITKIKAKPADNSHSSGSVTLKPKEEQACEYDPVARFSDTTQSEKVKTCRVDLTNCYIRTNSSKDSHHSSGSVNFTPKEPTTFKGNQPTIFSMMAKQNEQKKIINSSSATPDKQNLSNDSHLTSAKSKVQTTGKDDQLSRSCVDAKLFEQKTNRDIQPMNCSTSEKHKKQKESKNFPQTTCSVLSKSKETETNNDLQTSYSKEQNTNQVVRQTCSSMRFKPMTDTLPDISKASNIADDKAMDTSQDLQTPKTPVKGMNNKRNKRKRKSVDDLHHILLDVKRRKMRHCEWFTSGTLYCTDKERVIDANPIQTASTEMIHTILEDHKDISTGLWYLETHLSYNTYIQPTTISALINDIILSSDKEVDVFKAYYILSRMLILHPPVTNTMQNVYLHCFSGSEIWEDRRVGGEWDFISNCISSILSTNEISSGNRLMFRFIVDMLQANMHQFLIDPEMRADVKNKNLLVRIIWCPSYHVVFNQRCRQLLDFMSESIQKCKKITDKQDKVYMYEILDGILWLVAMVTECCRIQGNEGQDVIAAILCDNISVFVNEIAKRLIELNIKDPVLLQRVFQSLKLPWLRIGICQIMLNKLDDYLVTIEGDNHLINLLTIVSRYFFLLPQFDSIHGPLDMSSPARIRTIKARNNSTVSSNKKVKSTDKENIDKLSNKVNKRNHKGETALHVACRRNNLAAVIKLLKVPGIDVNVQDYAGWTALHEACNHGSIECIQELLKYVPAKTIDTFFQKDDLCKKVNLLAVNTEGITPLHDAVLCGHLDVCDLLLQHGGRTLLVQKTIRDFTPLDLCDSDEIYNLLKSYDNVDRRTSDSQGLTPSSQESNSSCGSQVPVIPSDSSYLDLLHVDGRRVYSNPTKLSLYVCLVKILLKNYITARNLFSVVDKLNKIKGTSLSKENGDQCGSNLINFLDGQICSLDSIEDEEHLIKIQKEAVPGIVGFNEPKVTENEVTDLKSELQVLRKLKYYVDCFQNHLKKISKDDFHNRIEKDILELYFFVDGLT
ncbi:SMC5-SMC6 complex localization factor protein 1 [Mactra antiquata]